MPRAWLFRSKRQDRDQLNGDPSLRPVISVIDAIIAKRQVENAIKPVDQQASG